MCYKWSRKKEGTRKREMGKEWTSKNGATHKAAHTYIQENECNEKEKLKDVISCKKIAKQTQYWSKTNKKINFMRC